MSTFSLIILLAVAIIVMVLAMIIMLALQIRSATRINKLTFPAYEYVMKQTEKKSDDMLQKAQEEARHIVTEAEKSGQKIVQEYRDSAVKTHDTYTTTLEQMMGEMSKQLQHAAHGGSTQLEQIAETAVKSIQEQQFKFLDKFSSALESIQRSSDRLEEGTEAATAEMKSRVIGASKELAEKLDEEAQQYTTRINERLDAAVARAEEQFVAYQKARTTLLDAHIEQLVEGVVSRVLHKQLTLTDHAELAREALAEAKKHNLL